VHPGPAYEEKAKLKVMKPSPDISKLGTAALLAEVDLAVSLAECKRRVDSLFNSGELLEDEWDIEQAFFTKDGPYNYNHEKDDEECWVTDRCITPRWTVSWWIDDPREDIWQAGIFRVNCAAPFGCGIDGCDCAGVLPPFLGEPEAHALVFMRSVIFDPEAETYKLPADYCPPWMMDALTYLVEDAEAKFNEAFNIVIEEDKDDI
jgi:hypothetical protein